MGDGGRSKFVKGQTALSLVFPSVRIKARHELNGIASQFAMQYLRFAM